MKLSDDNAFAEVGDGTETPSELGEEDQDFLKCLEKMMEEAKDESDSVG